MIIYYNPRCSKCREAKDLLEENNCEFEIRDYLKEPPSKKELRELVKLLGIKPLDLVRKTEALFAEKFSDKKLTASQWISVLSEHPILIQRPIVIDGEQAIIGRPPELILNLFK